ncbi:MAG: glycosyl transferase family 36, partial [Phycisphaerales bacterium]|nr:glycosyl transferase family 36 [Phycisphaerales bacterium]
MFANQYGHFGERGRSFVITDPRTPMPWVNVISNGRYGLVVSQNGGGFSWLDNSQLNVLTRWEMDLARDRHGKHLYLADRESGAVWSLAPSPCFAKYDEYCCEHKAGSTLFHTLANGIEAQWTLGVAPESPVEVWLVRLRNTTSKRRSLRIGSYMEWCCGVAPDAKREFHRLFFTCDYEPSSRMLVASKNMWDVPARSEREHWNRPWPYVAAHSVGGVEFESTLAISDKAGFLGRYGDTARPVAMLRSGEQIGPFGRFGDAAAALGGDLSIEPGQTANLYYLIGIAQTRGELSEVMGKFSSIAAVESALAGANQAWEDRLSPTQVQSARGDVDLLCNHWLPYQAISGRLWGRTGYYQQSGAFGFRDQLQDSMVWLNLDPARTREQILLHSRHQFADGSVYHWWHPLTEMGLRTACSDDYLWLAYITCQYMRETGDYSILSASEPFVDSTTPATLLEHCERSIARSFSRLSPRGIPLIGSCDWNDGLSAMGIEGRGESVWLGWFLCVILADMEKLYERIGIPAKAKDAANRRQQMLTALNTHAWDGNWYRYGTKDDGQWVGSSESAEGKIHLNAQTWGILSEGAPEQRQRQSWDSVRERLLTDYGPLLLAPAYTTPDPTIGYIT